MFILKNSPSEEFTIKIFMTYNVLTEDQNCNYSSDLLSHLCPLVSHEYKQIKNHMLIDFDFGENFIIKIIIVITSTLLLGLLIFISLDDYLRQILENEDERKTC